MSGSELLLAGLLGIFLALALATLVLATSTGEKRQVARSMGALQTAQGSLLQAPQTSFVERVLTPGLGRMAGAARRFSPAGINDKISRRLDLAGNPEKWDVERILAFKTLGMVGFGFFTLLLALPRGIGPAVVYVGIAAAAGFYLPDILLYNAGTKRQALMQKALPDALDLLTISVEAGLGFDAALSQVARNTPGPLAAEFFRVLKEMQIGTGRANAFRALSERTDLPELRGFITSMVQADSFGIPIANVLRTQAGEMRLKRQQRAEEKAQKVPVKVLFPLIFTILPALFVVILGPGVLSIMHSFAGR